MQLLAEEAGQLSDRAGKHVRVKLSLQAAVLGKEASKEKKQDCDHIKKF